MSDAPTKTPRRRRARTTFQPFPEISGNAVLTATSAEAPPEGEDRKEQGVASPLGENREAPPAIPLTSVAKSANPLPPRILRIIQRRRELGLTQEQLARMAGFSLSLMTKIERGAADPRHLAAERLLNLSRVLNLPFLHLVEDELPEEEAETPPLKVPLYPSLKEAQEKKTNVFVPLASPMIPLGATPDHLAFFPFPGPWLVGVGVPFLKQTGYLLVDLRPLYHPQGVMVVRFGEHAALVTAEDLTAPKGYLLSFSKGLPPLWPGDYNPELVGLVRKFLVDL